MNTRTSPFTHPDFRRWFAAETFLTISTSTTLATSLVIIDLSGSISLAGMISSIIVGGEVGAGILGGGLADIQPRRTLLRRSMSIALGGALILVFTLGAHQLGFLHQPSWLLGIVITAAIISAAAEACAEPAMDAAMKTLISPQQFPRALIAAQARSSALSLAGNPVTGALYAGAAAIPFGIRVLCQATFLGLLPRIEADLGPKKVVQRRSFRELGAEIVKMYRETAQLIFRDAMIRAIFIAAPLVNVMVLSASYWLVYSLRSHGESATAIGFASAGFAIGTLIGTLIAPWLSDGIPSGYLAIAALLWMALGFMAFFLASSSTWHYALWASIAMLPSSAIGSTLFAHIFDRTDTDAQGRILGTFTTLNGLAMVLAPLLAAIRHRGGSQQ